MHAPKQKPKAIEQRPSSHHLLQLVHVLDQYFGFAAYLGTDYVNLILPKEPDTGLYHNYVIIL